MGLLAMVTALLSLWKMEETFDKDLNYVEESTSTAAMLKPAVENEP